MGLEHCPSHEFIRPEVLRTHKTVLVSLQRHGRKITAMARLQISRLAGQWHIHYGLPRARR